MKILYDHQAFSLQRYGGVSRYFRELTSRVGSMEGYDVEIFAPFFVAGSFNGSPVRATGMGLPFSPMTVGAVRVANNLASRLLSRRRTDIDVYHETYYSTSDAAPPSSRRIVTVHDMIHEKFPECFSPSDATARTKRFAIGRADHVICVSESTRRDLMELTGIARERTSVVNHGPGLSRQTGLLRSEPRRGQRPFVLYVGVRSGYKNFPRLLYSLGSSSRFAREFDLVCFGGGAFSDRERGLISSSALDPRHVSQLQGDDALLASLYASASAMLYPSLYEGFGIPLLEAMSFGCPVICSNTSSIPEVVGNAAELFDPADQDSMTAAICRVLESGTRAAELAALGLARQQLFSWERCVQETVAVYADRAQQDSSSNSGLRPGSGSADQERR